MKSSDVEARVLRLADQVRAGVSVEDSRVQLKTEWPTADHKTARRLGGHANAARLEPILWVIGLDERGKAVKSANANEVSSWWGAVQKHFNGVPPDLLYSVNAPVGDAVAVGLLFDTARAPFVVTVPDASPFDREVPWREGNGTRSAKREDLLRILVPSVTAPRVDILQGKVHLNEQPSATVATWALNLVFYITPMTRDIVHIPFHTLRCAIRLSSTEIVFDRECRIGPIGFKGERSNIAKTLSEMSANGPGMVHLIGQGASKRDLVGRSVELELDVRFRTTDDHDVVLNAKLSPAELETSAGGAGAAWRVEGSRPLLDLPGSWA
jgi:hypothetical protein